MHVTTLTNPCNASSLAQRPTWQKSWSWHDHVHIPALLLLRRLPRCKSRGSVQNLCVSEQERSFISGVDFGKNCPTSNHFGLLPRAGGLHILVIGFILLQDKLVTTTISKFPEQITLEDIVADLGTENEKKKKPKDQNAENQARINVKPTERFRLL